MDVILSLIIFLPLIGAIMLLFVPRESINTHRGVALVSSLMALLASLVLWGHFNPATDAFQFQEFTEWFQIGTVKINYFLGVDGISLFLVILTTFITPVAILGSWSIRKHVREYMIFMLLLETGILGVFLSLDLVLFYLFWEIMLIPMYFLIGVWGSKNRVYAALKFFIYTMAGSLLMLVGILTLFALHAEQTGIQTFSFLQLRDALAAGELVLPHQTEVLLFLAFGVAFAIKVPLFPFHTWLPDAHVEAPTAGSVILAGVLLKMGTYGLLRFCLPLFPNASVELAPWVCGLAIIGIIYGALVAMVQPDVKKLVAYSSVSHLGYVVLGIFAFNLIGAQGATYQMLNHGLSTGALFLLVGMIYDRRHTRLIADFGGLAHRMPVFATFFMIITLASIGLPGLNGFVGEILILQGAFLDNILYGVLAASGMILSAVYMLWMYQRVFLGKIRHAENEALTDLNLREKLILTPIVILVVWMGVYSSPFLRPMDRSLDRALAGVQAVRAEDTTLEIREARLLQPLPAHRTDAVPQND